MPVETDLDAAFTILLGKAQGTLSVTGPAPTPAPTPGPTPTPVAQQTSYTVVFSFSGGGTALTAAAASPILVEVPDPGEIVWVHMYAGSASGQPVVVTATVDLQRTRWDTFGGSSPVYGSGTPPRIQADSQSNPSLTGWFPHLDGGETLIARLTSFSGLATWLTMVLRVRRDLTAQAQIAVLDGSGNTVLDAFGNPVIFRN